MLRVSIVCAVLGACIPEPKFKGMVADAPSEGLPPSSDGVTVTLGGGGATVSAELASATNTLRYGAVFGTSRLHMLEGLSLDGLSIHGRNSAINCSGEDETGIAVFPAERVSQNSVTTIEMANPVEAPLSGKAAGKVRINWRASYTCSTPATKIIDGESTFTFFPDGRIVRNEYFHQDEVTMTTFAECDCASGATIWFPTTFITFAETAFERIISESMGDQVIPAPTGFLDPGRYACAYRNTRQFAIAWPDQNTRVRRPGGQPGATLAFVYDLTTDHGTMPATYTYESRAFMYLDHEPSGCTRPLARAMESVAPRPLMVNAVSVPLDTIDGIYGGELPRQTPTGLAVSGNVTLQPTAIGAVGDGFAVWLNWGVPVTPRLTRTPADPRDPWYIMQRPTPNSAVIWFRGGLAGQERIEIAID